MTTATINGLLMGGIATLSFVAGLFFLHFWSSSGDRFFLFLMASFWLEAANRAHMGLTASWSEDSPSHYGVRLLSYGLILLTIWDKNRSSDK